MSRTVRCSDVAISCAALWASAVAELCVPSTALGTLSPPLNDNTSSPLVSEAHKRVVVPKALGRREELFMPHAVFRELQLGSVRPEGWLRLELTIQADGITGHQPDFCFPFDRRYWDSNERGQDVEPRNGGIFWYPWEQMGYWVDGAYRCARLVGDPHLRARAMEPIRCTVEHRLTAGSWVREGCLPFLLIQPTRIQAVGPRPSSSALSPPPPKGRIPLTFWMRCAVTISTTRSAITSMDHTGRVTESISSRCSGVMRILATGECSIKRRKSGLASRPATCKI